MAIVLLHLFCIVLTIFMLYDVHCPESIVEIDGFKNKIN